MRRVVFVHPHLFGSRERGEHRFDLRGWSKHGNDCRIFHRIDGLS
jgi:hypothetical protein